MSKTHDTAPLLGFRIGLDHRRLLLFWATWGCACISRRMGWTRHVFAANKSALRLKGGES